MKGIGRIKKAYRIVRRKLKPGALILMYHRVANLDHDPFELAVSPEHFEQHLEYINKKCVPMRLTDLCSDLVEGKLEHRSVAITFDDGYIDNLENAYPLLKSAGIPATLFIASDSIGDKREFWWDGLEKVFFTPDIPETLRLEVQDQQYEWRITTTAERRTTLMAVHQLVKYLLYDERRDVLDYLLRWAGVGAVGRPDYRPMNASELAQISQNGLVEIGAHTITHQALSSLSLENQREEISLCRQQLEALTGKQIPTFAYPYGKASDFTVDTVNVVRESGYSMACSTIPGSIETGDNIYRLKRFGIHDWDNATFKQYLENTFVS